MFRESCINILELDIIGIAETHLLHSQSLSLQQFAFYGHNRTRLHKHAKSGSGGVCLLVRKELLKIFDISILDKSCEGILWVSFKDRKSNCCFNVCTCYLPPHGSSRYVDAEEFYDKLLANIYEYQHLGKFIICGDFNSRMGDMADFIEGVDTIQERNIIDYSKNMYGEFLCKFLVDSNCCILNGRQCTDTCDNDFTFVSTRGKSVVDYFIVPYEYVE